MFSENEFYYCYSSKVFRFLNKDKGIPFICTGVHKRTKVRFFQFQRSNELKNALDEFNASRK